jgi:uncharacterized repeat protein (TIGR01451 family)
MTSTIVPRVGHLRATLRRLPFLGLRLPATLVIALSAWGAVANTEAQAAPDAPDATTVVIVTPSSLGGNWFPADTRPPGTGTFEPGPATPPHGGGSFELRTTINAAKVQLFTNLYAGTLLSAIQGIGYSTYRDPASTGFINGVSALNLRVDLDGNGSADAYVVYEPYQDVGVPAVLTGVWQNWDAYRAGAARWWINTGAGGCGQNTPCTWNTILGLFPNATIREAPNCGPGGVTAPCPGSLGLNQGSFNPDTVSNADGLYVSVGGDTTIFDFELNVVTDVSIAKACHARAIDGRIDEDVIYAGQQWICDITVNNPGRLALADFTITDTLRSGVTFVAHTAATDANIGGAPAACAPLPAVGPGQVSCTGLDVAAFSSTSFQLAFTTNPNFVSLAPTGELPIVNRACIIDVDGLIGVVLDPNLANNCDTETDIVKDLADLRITKFVEPFGTVRAGQIFTYTIYVDNLGPSAARRAVISDTLLSSGNVSIQSCAFSVSQGGGAITQFTCTTGNLVSTQFGSDIGTFSTNFLEPLTPDSQGRLRASFRLVAQQDIKVTNTARVSSLTPDPDMTNNFTETFLAVTGVTNLALTKTATAEEQQVNQPGLIFNNAIFGQVFPTAPNYFASTRVTAGRRIEYRLTVSNTGPSRAERVVLQDRLPGGVRIYQGSVVATLDPAGAAPLVTLPAGTCATGTPGDPLDKLTCGLGTMQVGDVATLVFQVITDSTLEAGAVLENDALVTADTLELNTTNNLAFTQNTVLTAADMALTKSNMGEVVTGVNPLTGELIVTDTANVVTAGMLLRYELSATNNGPSQALNVTVKDTLPSTNFVTYLRAVGADCRPDDVQQNILFCNLGTIPAGGRKTFDIYVRVKSSVPAGTNLANTALIQSNPTNTPGQPGPVAPLGARSARPAGKDQVVNPNLLMTWDPFLPNNTATSNAVVNAVADVGGGPAAVGAPLGLTKVDVPAEPRLDRQQEPDLAIAGKEHRYRISFGNAGPSDATGVTLVDALDFKQLGILGESFLRCEAVAPTDSATCSFTAPNTVTVTNFSRSGTTVIPGTIPAGNSYQIDLVVLVDPGYVLDAVDYIATDRATIATTAVDPNPANNTDTEDTEIIAEADLAVEKTDIFGTDPANGNLQCDPVAPGGMITYDITVSNRGPSDAATVLLEDRLPGVGVVLDPAQVQVSFLSGSGRLLAVRDDGRIQVLIGRDLNNRGEEQLGRLNTGGAVKLRIQVMAQANVPCGTVLRNQASVRTVKNYGATLEGANVVRRR